MGSQPASSDEPRGRGSKAILNPTPSAPIQITRHAPEADLAHWIEYVWIVRWSVAEEFVSRIIPQPVIHLASEDGRLYVHGVGDTKFSRTLRGDGHVVGIAFRPGGFHAVLRRPVNAITRSVQALGDVVDIDDAPFAERLLDPRVDDEGHLDTVDELFKNLAPQQDSMIDEMARLVTLAEQDPAMTRAEQLASEAGVSLRTLQRQFGEYIGIGPKWVIQRFRLLDAAAVANSGGEIDWAATAVDLGYADQAHLTRAFTTLVGTPPASYVQRLDPN